MLNVDQGTGSNVVDAVEASKIKLADIVSAIGAGLSVRLRGSNEIVVSKPNQAFKFDYNEIPVPGLSWFTNSANVTHYSCVIARLTETFKKEQLATNLLYIDATNFFALSNNPDRFVEMERQYREEQRESQLETNNEYQNAKTWVSYMKAGHLAERIASDHITFKMRTFEAALFTVAGEERKFAYYTNPDKELLWTNLTFRAAKFGPIATLSREPGLSYNLRPILMLHYGPSERSQLKIVAQINHDGDAYTIGDLEGANDNCDPLIDGNFNFYQNRTVFSIINYLFLQTAINSQNLPVQQLIQVQ
jgi:hypothetical protein